MKQGCTGQRAGAERQAQGWAKSMGIDPVGINCADVDTDGDGYVSCSVSSRTKAGEIVVTPVECASYMSFNDGCRTPKAVVRK